jgi:hypothetical protein
MPCSAPQIIQPLPNMLVQRTLLNSKSNDQTPLPGLLSKPDPFYIGQGFSMSWNLKLYYCIHKGPPWNIILS